jgi:hypothetical protein
LFIKWYGGNVGVLTHDTTIWPNIHFCQRNAHENLKNYEPKVILHCARTHVKRVTRSRNHCPHCIDVDLHVTASRTEVFIVAMEIQQSGPFALLSR